MFSGSLTRRVLILFLLLAALVNAGIGCTSVSGVNGTGTPLGVATLKITASTAYIDNTVVSHSVYFTRRRARARFHAVDFLVLIAKLKFYLSSGSKSADAQRKRQASSLVVAGVVGCSLSHSGAMLLSCIPASQCNST